jgi:hypothetical protein
MSNLIQIRLSILLLIRIRILHQILPMLAFLYFFHSNASLHCFILLVALIGVINFRIFGQYTEIFWKKA